MIPLGQKVYIIADRFEQNLPIGYYGYLIAYERNQDHVFDYVVRVPHLNKNFYVAKEDIEVEEVLIQAEVERIERDALIDYALATKNQALFHKIMNGEQQELEPEMKTAPQSTAEFVKQVNLKAWI